MKLQQHLNQQINIYLQRECRNSRSSPVAEYRKTSFIIWFIVTTENVI